MIFPVPHPWKIVAIHCWMETMVHFGLVRWLVCIVFDYQTRQISLHPLAVRYPQLKDVLVSTLFRDSRRRVWIGTEESLYMCADGEMRVMADSAGGLFSWPDTGVVCI